MDTSNNTEQPSRQVSPSLAKERLKDIDPQELLDVYDALGHLTQLNKCNISRRSFIGATARFAALLALIPSTMLSIPMAAMDDAPIIKPGNLEASIAKLIKDKKLNSETKILIPVQAACEKNDIHYQVTQELGKQLGSFQNIKLVVVMDDVNTIGMQTKEFRNKILEKINKIKNPEEKEKLLKLFNGKWKNFDVVPESDYNSLSPESKRILAWRSKYILEKTEKFNIPKNCLTLRVQKHSNSSKEIKRITDEVFLNEKHDFMVLTKECDPLANRVQRCIDKVLQRNGIPDKAMDSKRIVFNNDSEAGLISYLKELSSNALGFYTGENSGVVRQFFADIKNSL